MDEYQALLTTLRDTSLSGYQRRRALEQLVAHDSSETVAAISGLLDESDRFLRRDAVTVLAKLQAPGITGALVKALADGDDYVRRDAVEALASKGDPSCIPSLQALTTDTFYGVRDAAKRAVDSLKQHVPEAPAPVQVQQEVQLAPEPEPEPAPEPELEPASEPMPVVVVDQPAAATLLVEEPLVHQVATATIAPEPQPVRQPEPVMADQQMTGTTGLFHLDLSRELDWRRTPRLSAFFADHLEELKQAYDQLRSCQQELPRLADSMRGVLAELSWHQADKEDDLEDCRRSIRLAKQNQAKAEKTLGTAEFELKTERLRADTITFKLAATFSRRTILDHEKKVGELTRQVSEAGKVVASARERTAKLLEQETTLLAPISQRQQDLERLQETRGDVAEALMTADAAIDHLVLQVFLHTDDEELCGRLDLLAMMGGDDDFLKQSKQRLLTMLAAFEEAAHALREAEAADDQREEAVRDALDKLGGAIGDGFCIDSREAKTRVELQGNVKFESESNFFGRKGAEGTANGRGSGTATYEITELSWSEPASLGERIVNYSEAWRELGTRATEAQACLVQRDAAKRSLLEWVRYIRLELERDFQEVSA